jgi:hypothetical protein
MWHTDSSSLLMSPSILELSKLSLLQDGDDSEEESGGSVGKLSRSFYSSINYIYIYI